MDLGRRIALDIPGGIMGGRSWGPEGPPTLILFHANGFCGSTYWPLMAALGGEGHTVATLDLRGHGLTRLPADPDRQRSWHGFRDDILEALRRIAPAGAVLAGHSMGGASALMAAAAVPELARGLVLFDPVLAPRAFYLYARLPWVFPWWRRHFPMSKAALRRRAVFDNRETALKSYTGRGAFRTWQPGFLEGYVADGLTDTADGMVRLSCEPAFEAACFAGQAHDPHAAIARLDCPAHLLRAGQGSTCSHAGAAAMRRRGAQVETIADVGHFLPMQRPDLALAALRGMIARTAGT